MSYNPQQSPTIVLPLSQRGSTGGQEIRVRELFYVLWKRRTWMIIGAIIGVVFGLSLSVASYVKSQTIRQYSVKTSIALASQDENGLFSKSSRDPDSTDFHLAEDMVDAAQFILMSDSMLNRIIEDVNLLGVSSRDIYNSLSMSQYKQTQIIIINLYWNNPSEGVEILESMNRLAPKLLLQSLKLGSVTVINEPTAHFVIGGNLNLTRNLILGIMLGAFMAMALAVLDLILHPTLLTVTDVENRLKIPLMGTICENYAEENVHLELLGREGDGLSHSELADSYLAAAYSLKRHLAGQEHPCVLVTSAERGEGRTVITACLAAALSRIGVRVLAVDLDFTNPMLTGLFVPEYDPVHCINNLYQGIISPRDAVVHVNGTLDLLPALLEKTPMPLNTAAVDLIRQLRESYEVVLLDTPPVGQMADTMVLNELTEQAIFVMEYDGPRQAALQDAITRMHSVEIKVLGGVVNRMNRSNSDYSERKGDRILPRTFTRKMKDGFQQFKRLTKIRKKPKKEKKVKK